jgi:hypothetical protein
MTRVEFIKFVEKETGQPFEDLKIKKVIDYIPSSFEDLGDGNRWGVYKVTVEMDDGSEKEGFMQGDTHMWAFETFEK